MSELPVSGSIILLLKKAAAQHFWSASVPVKGASFCLVMPLGDRLQSDIMTGAVDLVEVKWT